MPRSRQTAREAAALRAAEALFAGRPIRIRPERPRVHQTREEFEAELAAYKAGHPLAGTPQWPGRNAREIEDTESEGAAEAAGS